MTDSQPFGILPSGKSVTAYTLQNAAGTVLKILDNGAIIASLVIRAGNENIDVVLGFDTIDGYLKSRRLSAPPYFGAVIGRYAGRIKDGRFSIGTTEYRLSKNNGANTLHGGTTGFDAVMWDVSPAGEKDNSLTLQYTSANGEEHFPGELSIKVTYILTDSNEVIIEYSATGSEDTPVNLTQHSYFNLDGHEGSVARQLLQLNSDKLTEILPDNIPTGNIISAAEKGFDFTTERPCPLSIDDSFVIEDHSLPAAMLRSEKTGLALTVFTDQPSVHIYVGGNCENLRGKENAKYHAQSGICFETQNFPDAPNRPEFPAAILKKGDTYRQRTVWKFTCSPPNNLP